MQRALIIAPNWIGDAVMAQPLIKQLVEQGLKIDVLATPWVAPVFLACSEVNEVITADFKHGGLQFQLRKQFAQLLKKKNYQQAYVLPNSWKSALIPWLAKIPIRIGYRGEMRFGLINRSLNNPPKVNRPPMVEHYAALSKLNPLASAVVSISHLAYPRLHIDKDSKNKALNFIHQEFPQARFIYILAPGAEYGPAKQWPLEHFAKLAEMILDMNPENAIFIIGSGKDTAYGQTIVNFVTQKDHAQEAKIKNVCGKVSLHESMALVSLAHGLASNDSGMMHIASALEIPQVAFFGSSDPKHTPALSKFAKALWLGLDCSPCHQRQCPLGHLRCLKEIKPESALQALQEQITKKG